MRAQETARFGVRGAIVDAPRTFSRRRLKAGSQARMGSGTVPAAVADKEWISGFAIAGDEAYFDRKAQRFGLDLWRKAKAQNENGERSW